MHLKPLHSVTGFTLIEVMMAMSILTIGILAVFAMQIRSSSTIAGANRVTSASNWNAFRIEQFVNMQYTNAAFTDTDNDGTNQDPDGNGIDEVGIDGDFGLNDATAVTADHYVVQGQYTIYWNVAEGVPSPNLKTIRILVQDTATFLARPIAYTYIKRQ
jgi:prepilin-type N-terminal cleavage/methylation domain-containing protein